MADQMLSVSDDWLFVKQQNMQGQGVNAYVNAWKKTIPVGKAELLRDAFETMIEIM